MKQTSMDLIPRAKGEPLVTNGEDVEGERPSSLVKRKG